MDKEIVIVGMGPGPLKYLTAEAREELVRAEEIFFRAGDHPVCQWLLEQGKRCVSFERLYAEPGITYGKVYETINRAVVKAALSDGKAVYALPGNPSVFEQTPRSLRKMAEEAGLGLRIVPGLSFLEVIYQELMIDPSEGLQILNGMDFSVYGWYPFTEKLGLLIGQVGFPAVCEPSASHTNNAKDIMECLLEKFPPEHKVTLVWSTGMPEYEIRKRTFPLRELAEQGGFVRHLASLYVPPLSPPWEEARKAGKRRRHKQKKGK